MDILIEILNSFQGLKSLPKAEFPNQLTRTGSHKIFQDSERNSE